MVEVAHAGEVEGEARFLGRGDDLLVAAEQAGLTLYLTGVRHFYH